MTLLVLAAASAALAASAASSESAASPVSAVTATSAALSGPQTERAPLALSTGPVAVATPVATADLRSGGEGAGAAGNPGGALWAFAVVVILGLAAAAATLAYVRLTDGRRSSVAAGTGSQEPARRPGREPGP